MRKIKLFSLALITGLLFSCSSDDNGGTTTSGEIAGKWFNKEYVVAGQTIPYDDHEECGKDFIEFSSNNTGRYVDINECEEESDAFTYAKDGNKLVITQLDGVENAEIVELSSTTLKLKFTYDFMEDGNEVTVIEVFSKN